MTPSIDFKNAPGITLTDAVEQFMILSFNDRKAYFLNHLAHASEVWKKLFWTTIFAIKEVELEVQYDKEIGYYLIKPRDMSRLISIQARKGDMLHSLLLSPDVPMHINSLPVSKKCSCNSNDQLCDVIDTKIITHTENFNGEDYILKTFYEHLESGDINKVEEFVSFDHVKDEVIIEQRKVAVERVKTKACGCIKDTPDNRIILASHCGCGLSNFREDGKFILRNEYGYYNHRFEGDKIFLYPANKVNFNAEFLPKRINVAYQTNGKANQGEVILPDYASMTFNHGMNYFIEAFRKNQNSRLVVNNLKATWEEAQVDLLLFMNPFDLEAFAKLETIFPKW